VLQCVRCLGSWCVAGVLSRYLVCCVAWCVAFVAGARTSTSSTSSERGSEYILRSLQERVHLVHLVHPASVVASTSSTSLQERVHLHQHNMYIKTRTCATR
jgi:hypothetical protein